MSIYDCFHTEADSRQFNSRLCGVRANGDTDSAIMYNPARRAAMMNREIAKHIAPV